MKPALYWLVAACLLLGAACKEPPSRHDQRILAGEAPPPGMPEPMVEREPEDVAPENSPTAASPTAQVAADLAHADGEPAPIDEQAETAPVDNRPVGPTTWGYFIVESTDGRKAELLVYNRSEDGVLYAKDRNRGNYEFSESRLTQDSRERLFAHLVKHDQLNVNISNRGGYRDDEAGRAKHYVQVTCQAPISRKISVETFYTSENGEWKRGHQLKHFEISKSKPVEMEFKSEAKIDLFPTVVVRDDDGKMIAFDSDSQKMRAKLQLEMESARNEATESP